MLFQLSIPRMDDTQLELTLELGQIMFVLGANGSGKSSLIQQFYSRYQKEAIRISGHRQTWFSSNGNHLSFQQRQAIGTSIGSNDATAEARWQDVNSAQRAHVAIYDLVNAINIRARCIADAFDNNTLDSATACGEKDAPIKSINELFELSSIPIKISINDNQEIIATKGVSSPYSIAELSDGERNALLLAASILTAKAGVLILIDEPELHMHRSIISPLLTHLFSLRPDCAFVISTHDIMLPLDNPDSRSLLIRSCTYSGSKVIAWDADLICSATKIDDGLKKDILGARRKLLFVEGVEKSLDKALYSLIFSNVSVIPKSNCRDVDDAVTGIRGAKDLHRIHAFGIVDNDRRTRVDLDKLKTKGVHALSVYSVESIYYHPEIQRRIAERKITFSGGDASINLDRANKSALDCISKSEKDLCDHVAEKVVREQFFKQLPSRKAISGGKPIYAKVEVQPIVTEEIECFRKAVQDGDLTTLIMRYPVHKTAAFQEIAVKLGLQDRRQYEDAVLQLLKTDEGALKFVKSLFGALIAAMNAVDSGEGETESI